MLTIEEKPKITLSPDTANSKLSKSLKLQEVLDSGDAIAQNIYESTTTVNLKPSYWNWKGKTVALNWTVSNKYSVYDDDFWYCIYWTPENNKFSGAEYGLPDSVVIPE